MSCHNLVFHLSKQNFRNRGRRKVRTHFNVSKANGADDDMRANKCARKSYIYFHYLMHITMVSIGTNPNPPVTAHTHVLCSYAHAQAIPHDKSNV